MLPKLSFPPTPNWKRKSNHHLEHQRTSPKNYALSAGVYWVVASLINAPSRRYARMRKKNSRQFWNTRSAIGWDASWISWLMTRWYNCCVHKLISTWAPEPQLQPAFVLALKACPGILGWYFSRLLAIFSPVLCHFQNHFLSSYRNNF